MGSHDRMTPDDLKSIRHRLGLTGPAFARALGYGGDSVRQTIGRLEHGRRRIPPAVAALAVMYDKHGLDPEAAALAEILGAQRAEE